MFSVVHAFQMASHHDAIIIGTFENEGWEGEAANIDQALNNQLSALKKNKRIKTKCGEVTTVFTLGQLGAEAVYVVGLGKKEELTLDKLRQAFGAVSKKQKSDRLKHLAICLQSFVTPECQAIELAFTFGEALALGTYQLVDYKEKTNEVDIRVESVMLYVEREQVSDQLTAAAENGYIFGGGVNRARTLVNIPANLLTPSDLAEESKQLAEKHGFELEILGPEEMERLGMGALLAVAAGSEQPPRMIILKYQGKEAWEDVIGLVGKGLTFDSGGISLKPSANMHEMKSDMGGAAAVLGAMDIIGQLKPAENVLAVIPSTENLVNGKALKPGDVIRSLSGKTIEVKNTDAEGRLILADGLAYAKQLGADYLIDVATLTGAVGVALGNCTTGVVANHDRWMEQVEQAALKAGEWIWRFPNHQPYLDLVKSSDVADLNNAPGRAAGSITAGLFLGEFAEETPWVHLDIAGTALQHKASSLGPAGGTGVMVRTLAHLIVNK